MMLDIPAFPILLYGNSLRLLALESYLRANTDLQIVHIDPTHTTAIAQLAVMGESILLYDPQDVDSDVIHAIHVLHPSVMTVALENGRSPHDTIHVMTALKKVTRH